MAKDMADKERIKAERLKLALRANLRRRKAPTNDVGQRHKDTDEPGLA